MRRRRREPQTIAPSRGSALDNFQEWLLSTEPWVSELRAQLADAGHDHTHVEALLRAALTRLRSWHSHAAFPLLVERWVARALRATEESRDADQAIISPTASFSNRSPRP